MSSLRHPPSKRAAGSLAGAFAYIFVNGLFRLPEPALLRVLAFAARLLRRVSGEGPAARAVDDLHFVFSRGGESALILRKLITESRPEEVIALVRGAVIRGMT